MEEAGIRVKNVRYHSSHRAVSVSLMIGCIAEADTTDIQHGDVEMTDVKWFESRGGVEGSGWQSDQLTVPGRIAIAHHLIKSWANGEKF